ncbi:hypothetical protein AA106555_0328 [Neokomagataea thailandica NBRC 106555]|nr:hypothetical protein AA106555_0328 [Neokomagataea thailandica NBRC 106555]
MEAVGGVGLWLQYTVVQALQKTRLSTSTGTDCDSFVADFGMARLQGEAATGAVTLLSFTPDAQSAVVLSTVILRTVSGLSFSVVKDETHPLWSANMGGYVRAQGQESIDVPVVCQIAGSLGNVDEGAICLMGTAVSGIDTVTNQSAFSNGVDAETDEQLRLRFPLWLSAKATASKASIENAISDVRAGLSYAVEDGRDAGGNLRSGYFTAVVNDGSGTPTQALLRDVYAAIDSTRAVGVGFAVQAPSVLELTVSMDVSIPYYLSEDNVREAIRAAIASDIVNTPIGSGYAYSRLSYLAYVGANVAVTAVSNVLLNNNQNDIPKADAQSLSVKNINININKS